MFDSVVYIPAILAYAFVSLLFVIVGFIVIYVSHRIYETIYDNLPVAQLASSSSHIGERLRKSMTTGGIGSSHALVGRKSKTALRIIVRLEPCYLAFMLFKPYWSPDDLAASNSLPVTTTSAIITRDVLVKYYDHLATIPSTRQIKRYEETIHNFKTRL